MRELYELGKIAAIADLEDAARQGDELAIKIASALPEELKDLPAEVKTAAWEMQEKVAGAKTDAVKSFSKDTWSKARNFASEGKENLVRAVTGKSEHARNVSRDKDAMKGYAEKAKAAREAKDDAAASAYESFGKNDVSTKERLMTGGKHLGAAGVTGGVGYMALKGDKKKKK